MKRYVLPYEDVSSETGFPAFIRRDLIFFTNDWRYHPGIWLDTYGRWWRGIKMETYPSKEKAMKGLDDILIQYGYHFISNERAKKLIVLL